MFKKGQVTNPNGRPKRKLAIPDILRRIGNEPISVGSKITKLEDLMRVVYREARAGEPWAVSFIADRTEGKVVEKVEVNDTTPHKVQFVEVKVRTIPRNE